MGIIHQFRNYLLEESFELKAYKNMVNVVNFTSIGHFDSYKVVVEYEGGKVVISGEDLVVSKLMSDEILITGKISSIEFR